MLSGGIKSKAVKTDLSRTYMALLRKREFARENVGEAERGRCRQRNDLQARIARRPSEQKEVRLVFAVRRRVVLIDAELVSSVGCRARKDRRRESVHRRPGRHTEGRREGTECGLSVCIAVFSSISASCMGISSTNDLRGSQQGFDLSQNSR